MSQRIASLINPIRESVYRLELPVWVDLRITLSLGYSIRYSAAFLRNRIFDLWTLDLGFLPIQVSTIPQKYHNHTVNQICFYFSCHHSGHVNILSMDHFNRMITAMIFIGTLLNHLITLSRGWVFCETVNCFVDLARSEWRRDMIPMGYCITLYNLLLFFRRPFSRKL